jgi:hypothetical protein
MNSREFFWLHIKKGGGQSFRKTFTPPYVQTDRRNPKPFCALPREEWNDALNNFRLPLGEYDYRRTLFAKKFLYSEAEFSGLYKFVIVRNPYDRAVSCWNYLARPKHRGRWFRSFERKAFEAFLDRLPEQWQTKRNRHLATHSAPMWPDITGEQGELLMDEIFKLEEMDRNLPYLCAQLGIPERSYAHVRGGGPRAKDYTYYYSEGAKRRVEALFGEDIENLKYLYSLPRVQVGYGGGRSLARSES